MKKLIVTITLGFTSLVFAQEIKKADSVQLKNDLLRSKIVKTTPESNKKPETATHFLLRQKPDSSIDYKSLKLNRTSDSLYNIPNSYKQKLNKKQKKLGNYIEK